MRTLDTDDNGTTLEALCASEKVTVTLADGEYDPEWPDAHNYKATLRYQGRRITVPFHTGSGWTREPSAADVLGSLCSDAMCVENAASFDEFCRDLGYDTDSRKAERAFKACQRIHDKLVRFLGDAYERFCNAEH